MPKGDIISGARIGEAGRFESVRGVPLSNKVFGLRLPTDIDQQVREKGHDWAREVLRQAIARESLPKLSAEARAVQRIAQPLQEEEWIELPESTDEERNTSLERLRGKGYQIQIPD